MSVAYPKDLPIPTRRKGALSYEIRVRVPQEARGEKFKGTHTTRTLGTRDKAQALRNRLKVYIDLQAEFEAEATRQASKDAAPSPPHLSVEDVCRIQRERLHENERTFRKEHIAGFRGDSVQLAEQYRVRLLRSLESARANAIVHDFGHEEWLLNYLASTGQGVVADRQRALSALARTKVQVLQEMIADDDALALEAAVQQQPGVPTLKEHASAYLARRGGELTGERRALIEAVVRDFIALTGGDKAVTAYSIADAARFTDALLSLPANWIKNRSLRNLDIAAAAAAAKDRGMARQSAESIRKKVSLVAGIFADARERYSGVTITFPTKGLPKRVAANEQRDPFQAQGLAKLLASEPPGHLKWLTWLGLYTGARLNELSQLTAKHVRKHGNIHFLRFGSDMRLKSGACVRSVPIHSKLIEIGFLDYVAKQQGLLFPGIAQHSSGRYSDAPSKAFRRHLEKIGIKRPKLSFHSLRHSFGAQFKIAAPRDAETRERLLGHEVPGISGRYGGSYEAEANDMELLARRAEVLSQLSF